MMKANCRPSSCPWFGFYCLSSVHLASLRLSGGAWLGYSHHGANVALFQTLPGPTKWLSDALLTKLARRFGSGDLWHLLPPQPTSQIWSEHNEQQIWWNAAQASSGSQQWLAIVPRTKFWQYNLFFFFPSFCSFSARRQQAAVCIFFFLFDFHTSFPTIWQLKKFVAIKHLMQISSLGK